ncbi:hypothetical protein [Streptomyces sp. Wb2n-11]|uniref:hypothetical protein n=1 Tax=Streptomyces sp. Wb2n-11 TaxID=1030533 RepID=UPI000A95B183|nr:hypothetical protein [Streptomyces sp. Wb2n-11]
MAAMPTPAVAAAATKCTGEQHKEVDTIGPNLDLCITLCVTRDNSNNLKAHTKVRWSDDGGGASAGMEKIDVELHLQRNDSDYRIKTYNYAAATNMSKRGNITHSTDSYHSSTGG